MLLPTRTHRSFSAELLPNISGPTLQICQHSSFPWQELVFVLAGFHNVPIWGPLKSSPAFKHVTCSPSLMSSANLMRSTINRHQRQVMALDELFPLQDELFPLQKHLPPPPLFHLFYIHCSLLHPNAGSTSTTPQHCTIHRKYCRPYLDFQHIRYKH